MTVDGRPFTVVLKTAAIDAKAQSQADNGSDKLSALKDLENVKKSSAGAEQPAIQRSQPRAKVSEVKKPLIADVKDIWSAG